jgi:hypothetical protein
MSIRFLTGCAAILAAVFIAPIAHAQGNVVLVTEIPGPDDGFVNPLIEFFSDADVFDNVPDAIVFANIATNRVDTIMIDEGTWPMDFDHDGDEGEEDATDTIEPPELTASVKLEGLGHPNDVILVGASVDGMLSPVLTVALEADVVIESLTLKGGLHGVQTLDDSTVIVNRCIIRSNQEYGVMINKPTTPSAFEHAIYNSAITDNGLGGILVEGDDLDAKLTVLGCSFIDNVADAIALPDGANADVHNTLIYRNGGFGISGNDGIITYDYNYISENSAPTGGSATFVVGLNNIDPTDAALLSPDPEVFTVADAGNWKGKILEANVSPLRDNGDTIDVEPYTTLDLDGDLRTLKDPTLNPPDTETNLGSERDIGADESFLDPALNNAWYFAEVIPDPAPAMPAGALSVRLRGVSINADTDAHILTELGEEIPLEMIELAAGYYAGKNAEPILADEGYDGRANIMIGQEPQPDSQAVTGRTFIIDTLPPIKFVDLGGRAANFFVSSNDGTVATALPPVLPPAGIWRPATEQRPWSAGLIRPLDEQALSGGGQAAQIFLNDPPISGITDLVLTVTVEFSDLGPDGGVAGGGFDIGLNGAMESLKPEELTGTVIPPFNMPTWILDEGALPSDATIEATFVVGGATGLPGSEVYTTMTVEWIVTIPTISNDSTFSLDDGYHWAIRFEGQDQAGNSTNAEDLLEPLHIWYLPEAQATLSPLYDREVNRPSFEWNLTRRLDPGPSEPSGPRFRYRLLKSIVPLGSSDAVAKPGPYVPVTEISFLNNGWSPVFSSAKRLPFEWFNQPDGVIDRLAGVWLVLVVTGADEAGNMELWPTFEAGSGMTGGELPDFYNLNINAGRNWQRFMVPGPSEQIETRINAEFWWDSDMNGFADSVPDESFFGESKIIPLPPIQDFNLSRFPNPNTGVPDTLLRRVEAEFRIQVVSPSTQKKVEVEFIDVSIPANSTFPTLIDVPVGRDSVDVLLAFSGFKKFVGDPARKQPRHYIIRAWGVSNGIRDSTPASYAFTVVPTIQGYIENKQSADDQPIKVIESN